MVIAAGPDWPAVDQLSILQSQAFPSGSLFLHGDCETREVHRLSYQLNFNRSAGVPVSSNNKCLLQQLESACSTGSSATGISGTYCFCYAHQATVAAQSAMLVNR
jgi:hypothetical protein